MNHPMSCYDLVLENYRNDSIYRSIQINSLETSVESMEKSMEIIRRRMDNLNIKATVDGELASLNPGDRRGGHLRDQGRDHQYPGFL